MKIFILEDEIALYPRIQIVEALEGHDFHTATSFAKAKNVYTKYEPFELLLLDHDLEGNYEHNPDHPNTGMQFVKWLVAFHEAHERPLPQVFIHSWNNVGARNMQHHLQDHGWTIVDRVPFGQDYVKALKALKPAGKKLMVQEPKDVDTKSWETEFYTRRTK
jgi:hypothetical protein